MAEPGLVSPRQVASMAEPGSVRPRQVVLGRLQTEFPSLYLQPLEDSTELLDDPEQLRQRLNDLGYLFIQGLHRREDVLEARLAVLDHIRQSGQDKLDSGQPWQQGVLDSRCGWGCIPSMEGLGGVAAHEAVRRVIEGERPRAFFKRLFKEDPMTLSYKWLRGVHRQAYTGIHVDWVYMGRGTRELLTMWSPLDEVPVEMGTLAVCEASHRLPPFSHLHQTYGECDIEAVKLQGTGWFSRDPREITEQFGGQWKTADFQPGDVLIFTMKTLHMSTANLTDKVRISCDTRWQPASAPVDQRYMHVRTPEGKFGFHGEEESKEKQGVSMDELKLRWGFKCQPDKTL